MEKGRNTMLRKNRHARLLKVAVIGAALVLWIPSASRAQSPEILAVVPAGSGARPVALGEAYHALGGDIYSLYYNPAGLGLARGLSIEGGVAYRATTLDTRYFNNPSTSRVSSTGLDALGVIYAVPTDRGNLVFAFGAHRLRDLDNRYLVEGYNDSDHPDLGDSWIWARDIDRGSLYSYAAGVSIEVAEGFFLGTSLEAISGSNSYTYLLEAYDTEDVWTPYGGHTWDDGTDYTYRSRGLRIAVGGLWRPLGLVSFGGSIKFPSSIQITEDWYQSEVLYYDDDTYEVTYDDSGIYDYYLRLPYEFGVGAALTLGGVTLTGGGSYYNYAESWYSRAPYDGFDPDFFAMNYKPDWQLGGGIEIRAAGGAAVRAGYRMEPLQFLPAGLQVISDREIYSFGLGWDIGNTVHLDLAYRHARWKTHLDSTSETWDSGRFLMSFGYRF